MSHMSIWYPYFIKFMLLSLASCLGIFVAIVLNIISYDIWGPRIMAAVMCVLMLVVLSAVILL